MGLTIDRTVRRVEPKGAIGRSQPLSAYRETPAWVLLGDPGTGKTTAFRAEESAAPKRALFVSARDFLTFDPEDHPEWRERTLFLDGLDEVRAGKSDERTPFDRIRHQLDRLGKPRFRLSCREADWLGKNDRQRLKSVSPDGEVLVLRLDSLTRDEVRAVVSDLLGESGLRPFLTAVSERGLDSLLGNLQNLELLARVFRVSGQLPSSRWETFERASALLARETNEEHRIGGQRAPIDSLLDAAGRLSAVELLSDAAGFCDSEDETTDGYFAISAYGETPRKEIRASLRTRLFTAEKEGRFRSAHSHLAAFLAARYSARLIRNGVSGRRILALLLGPDGVPTTPLRGLAAWLAVATRELRRPIIDRDPVAVLFYGDVRRFTVREKAFLLDRLGRDALRFYESYGPLPAVEGLASTEMEPVILEHLRNSDRSRATQSRVEVIAEAIRTEPWETTCASALLAVVEDSTYWPRVRRAAFNAWVCGLADAPDRASCLRVVLVAIHEGRISDPDRQLLGLLLEELYPADIGPSDVWDYFTVTSGLAINEYYMFWKKLGGSCPDHDIPTHLDRLSDSTRPVVTAGGPTLFHRLPLQLLARGLQNHGTRVDVSRLFRWLQVGMDAPGKLTPLGVEASDEAKTVAQWLEAHPGIQKALIRFALNTPALRVLESTDDYMNELLYRSALPDDIGSWHLDEAAATDDTHMRERHIRGFLRALVDRPIGVDQALANARTQLKARPGAFRFLEANLHSEVPDSWIEHAIRWRHLRAPAETADPDLLEAVRSQQASLLKNCASAALLYDIARRHQDGSLRRALGGNETLYRATLLGLRRAIHRPDLPSADELVRLRLGDRASLFTWPVLTGLADTPADEVMAIEEERLRTALTCRLLWPDQNSMTPWYLRCVTRRPDLVAEVLVRICRVLFKRGDTSISDLSYLAHSEDHMPVARRATLPLLRAFPTRATRAQLPLLDNLLLSALRYSDSDARTDSLRDIIESKSTSRSTSVGARTRWLSAGVILWPDMFLPELSEELSRSNASVRSCAEFYEPLRAEPPPWLFEGLTLQVIAVLVSRLGPVHGPDISDGRVKRRAGIRWFVSNLITRLSEFVEEQAELVLSRLVTDDDLQDWRPHLESAIHAQRIARRDAGYAAPAPREVIEALNDGPPATAADLRGLVVDRLETIAEEIRTTNANLWRQFWNEDTGTPKHENACRDALLPLLRSRLPDGCDAQPEGQYAANRRADIRVASGEWNVPVEIKKNSHSDLWRAVANQLLSRYASDPATEGLGIYLVLWMEPTRTASLEKGDRPETPADLRERLLESLKPDERRRAEVVVLDVTPPPAPAGEPGQAPKISRK